MKSFKQYGIVHWVGKMKISNTTLNEIKTVNTKQDQIVFYIEGISSSGDVFSQKIVVEDKNTE